MPPCSAALTAIDASLAAIAGPQIDLFELGNVAYAISATVANECSRPGPRHALRLRAVAEQLLALRQRAEEEARQGQRPRPKKTKNSSPSAASAVARETTVDLGIAVGPDGSSRSLRLVLPAENQLRPINDPAQLANHVRHVWERVVAPHQTGLAEARAPAPSKHLSSEEAWHHYVAGRSGVVDSARLLVAFSVVPGLQSGATPLHAAAARGACARIAHLLARGHGVDSRATDGTTALHHAAATNQPEAIAALLAAGAELEAVGDSGATPLMVATSMGHVDASAALLSRGALPSRAHLWSQVTPLHLAAEMGHAGLIALLCRARADVEATKSNGGTALHTAADSGMPRAVQALLAPPCSSDPNALLAGDTTPLYFAGAR